MPRLGSRGGVSGTRAPVAATSAKRTAALPRHEFVAAGRPVSGHPATLTVGGVVGLHPELFVGLGNELTFFHRMLLADRHRTGAFVEALTQQVRPGSRVIDLGTGSGVLAVAAARAGALTVHAVEGSEMVEVAEESIPDGDRAVIQLVGLWSPHWEPPRPADLLVSECLDHWAICPMLDEFLRVAKSWLIPGGVRIPRRIRLYVALLKAPEVRLAIGNTGDAGALLDTQALERRLFNSLYLIDAAPDDLLSDPVGVSAIDVGTDELASVAYQGAFRVTTGGLADGMVGWFEADLSPSVLLSTAPGKPETVWRQVFFPFSQSVRIAPGDELQFAVRAYRQIYGWSVSSGGRIGKVLARQSTLGSYPALRLPIQQDAALAYEDVLLRVLRNGIPTTKADLATQLSSAIPETNWSDQILGRMLRLLKELAPPWEAPA